MVVLNIAVQAGSHAATEVEEQIIDGAMKDSTSVASKVHSKHSAIHAGASTPQQEEAVRDLVSRIMGPKTSNLFHLHVTGDQHQSFSVKVENCTIFIDGSNGVEVAAGVHWFLKYWTQSSYSWEATGGLQLNQAAFEPASLTEMQAWGTVKVERQVSFSYYQNVVTLSYSMAYWDWARWEQEIDWMALQGINLPLAPAGIEYIWLQTFEQFGISAAELEDFFPGPSFLAWGRMGNLQGYGGPLPASYMVKQADLQRKIVARMRALGMTPVFPGFAGFVPRAFVAKHPQAHVSRATPWTHFAEPYCSPYMLDPQDPLFQTLGTAYVRTLRREFGWDQVGFYIADSFNEMRPASADPSYLTAASAAVYSSLTAADQSAVWLMQAWLFFSDQAFWQPPQIQALLQGAPRGRLILLDLFAEEHALWERTHSFYGCPFIWCMLHNFGGNLELYGALPAASAGFRAALAAAGSTCVGMGVAPEGLEQNPAVYEFATEMAFKQLEEAGRKPHSRPPGPQSDLAAWSRAYGSRRYPGAAGGRLVADGWALLGASAYSCPDHRHNTVCDVPTSRPAMSRQELVGWGLAPHTWYEPRLLLMVWEGLIEAATSEQLQASCSLQYDLVDVGREVMSKLSTGKWRGIVDAYNAGDKEQLREAGQQLLELLDDMEKLASCHSSYLLGRYLAAAKAFADTPQERELYELNARTQITIWGTSASGDSEVSDYANREWAGLLSSFYRPRWAMWIQLLQEDLQEGRPYDASAWRQHVLSFTLDWAGQRDTFPEAASGDALEVSRELLAKYGPAIRNGGHMLRSTGVGHGSLA